nr:hypothetical protein [Tanacetum cinerariifolium]
MVAFLKKPQGSESFHQILDFLNASHIRTITEASVRRHLKLTDAKGISTLPTTKIFTQLDLIGVTTLENELSNTKAVYHKAFITLTKRVKKLETQLKQKRSKAVIHSSDEEEPSLDIKDSPKQGWMIEEINKDENVNLVSEQGEVHETVEPLKDDDDATFAKTLLN